LRNDLGRHRWIKKSISYDLANDLIGSAVVAFWAWFKAFQSRSPLALKLIQNLVVTLSRIAELLCGLDRAQPFTLALKEHGQLKGDFIVFPNGKRPLGAREKRYTIMDLAHRLSPPEYEMNDYPLG
jgi:hypothetical protein